MGRPPLKVRKTTIRLPEDIFDRITALVGQRRMAEFIRDAVVTEVERRERDSKPAASDSQKGN